MIAKELTNLWISLNFPIVSHQQVQSKTRSVVDLYKKYRKRKSEQVEKELKGFFDIIEVDGNWLCSKDKKLYTTQIQTSGRVGYSTRKEADLNSIHRSKRKFIQSQPSTSGSHSTPLSCEINEENDVIFDSIDNESDDDFKPVEEIFSKYNSAASAARLVSKHSLSTKKAVIVCKSLKEDGVDIASPTQVGVWKHVIKEAERKKVNIKAILQSETFCLYFSGKVLLKTEYQVVCLQNENRIINLEILTCKNGSSRAIFEEIKTLMDEYDAWKSNATPRQSILAKKMEL